jgi:hypothetical protein
MTHLHRKKDLESGTQYQTRGIIGAAAHRARGTHPRLHGTAVATYLSKLWQPPPLPKRPQRNRSLDMVVYAERLQTLQWWRGGWERQAVARQSRAFTMECVILEDGLHGARFFKLQKISNFKFQKKKQKKYQSVVNELVYYLCLNFHHEIPCILSSVKITKLQIWEHTEHEQYHF